MYQLKYIMKIPYTFENILYTESHVIQLTSSIVQEPGSTMLTYNPNC